MRSPRRLSFLPAPLPLRRGGGMVAGLAVSTLITACALGPGARVDDAAATGDSTTPPPVAREVATPTTTGPAAIDPPAPGRCKTVVYTPPTASAPQSGELCRPLDPIVDTAGAETVVVLVHGGGGYSGTPGQTDGWQAQHLAAGRSTFTITYTLLDPSAPATTFPVPEQNTKAAVQWVRSASGLDDPTIVLHGFSAGARLGAIVATTAGDPLVDEGGSDELWTGVDDGVDGAILFYGYYDGMQFLGADYYGDTDPATASAIAAADATDPELLLVHGTDDGLTPTAGSEALAAALDEAGGSAQLVLVDGADHAFDGYGRPVLTAAGTALVPAIDDYTAGLS